MEGPPKPTTAEEKAAMDEPFPAQKCPYKVQLQTDKTYYFCTCGLSSNQPFCDGSHSGTCFSPKAFVPRQDGDNYLCGCKHNKPESGPYCDGSHTNLEW